MLGKNNKLAGFIRATVIVGFLLFLSVFLLCNFSPTLMAMGHHAIFECTLFSNVNSLTPLRDSSGLYGFLLLLLIVSVRIVQLHVTRLGHNNIPSCVSFWRFAKTTQYISKLYNPIFEALYKGIIHPKVFNTAVFIN